MKLFNRRRKRQPKIEIIPMVDVMVLLLVFYILSSVALSHQHGIPVHLPRAATGEGTQVEEVVITIDRGGRFFLNQEPTPAGELGGALKKLAQSHPGGLAGLVEGNIVINADLGVEHGAVVRAMDELRKVGVNNFAIATETREGASE